MPSLRRRSAPSAEADVSCGSPPAPRSRSATCGSGFLCRGAVRVQGGAGSVRARDATLHGHGGAAPPPQTSAGPTERDVGLPHHQQRLEVAGRDSPLPEGSSPPSASLFAGRLYPDAGVSGHGAGQDPCCACSSDCVNACVLGIGGPLEQTPQLTRALSFWDTPIHLVEATALAAVSEPLLALVSAWKGRFCSAAERAFYPGILLLL